MIYSGSATKLFFALLHSPSIPLEISLEDGSLKECGDRFGLDSYEVEVFPNVEEKSLVDGVLVGAFGGVREDDAVICDDVEVLSSSLVKSTNSCLGDEDDRKNGEEDYLIWKDRIKESTNMLILKLNLTVENYGLTGVECHTPQNQDGNETGNIEVRRQCTRSTSHRKRPQDEAF
nr:hypothetical protein [Tanacetum cinerariifolium]